MESIETEYGLLTLAFAKAIVNGEFISAHSMLSQELQDQLSPDEIQAEYESMIEYGEGSPNFIEVMNVMDNWPEKLKADIGWAYCAISGPDYAEAVTVIISNENGKQVIREIEWGRP